MQLLKMSMKTVRDPEFRRKSFEAFSNALRKYQHTTAATYNQHVQQEKLRLI